MSDTVFKYPGGKTQLFGWIEDHIKQHRTWVDVFGGSGVVTANKDPSKVEVYNDRDGDLVHFFTTLRDLAEELEEWLRQTPHSRELHQKYSKQFYAGYRPEDDIERAGRFFYLRFTQWGTKYTGFSGYNGSTKRSAAGSYRNAVDRLGEWQERFSHVQLERLDFGDLIDRYDSPETLFYCDPPYMDEGDDLYSHTGGFDHGRFVDALLDAEGDWLVSYTRVPKPLRDAAECITEQDRRVRMRQGQGDWEKTNTERLVMNYDPATVSLHADVRQSDVSEWW
jgi:DNA adenine methylase